MINKSSMRGRQLKVECLRHAVPMIAGSRIYPSITKERRISKNGVLNGCMYPKSRHLSAFAVRLGLITLPMLGIDMIRNLNLGIPAECRMKCCSSQFQSRSCLIAPCIGRGEFASENGVLSLSFLFRSSTLSEGKEIPIMRII